MIASKLRGGGASPSAWNSIKVSELQIFMDFDQIQALEKQPEFRSYL